MWFFFKMFLQQSTSGLNFSSVQLTSGNSSNVQQLAPINMQGQVVQSNQTQSGMNTGHTSTPHMIQQQPLQSTASQVKLSLVILLDRVQNCSWNTTVASWLLPLPIFLQQCPLTQVNFSVFEVLQLKCASILANAISNLDFILKLTNVNN